MNEDFYHIESIVGAISFFALKIVQLYKLRSFLRGYEQRFISTATTWNCSKTKVPFEWLAKKIDVFSDIQPIQGYAIGMYHYVYSTREYENSNAVIAALKEYVPGYEKHNNMYPILISKLQDAIKHERQLEKYHMQEA